MAKRKRKSTGPHDASLRWSAFRWWLFDAATFVAVPLWVATLAGAHRAAHVPYVDTPHALWVVAGVAAAGLYVVRRIVFGIEWRVRTAREAAADAAAKLAAAAQSTRRPGRSLRGRDA